jgi:hypothetical protein
MKQILTIALLLLTAGVAQAGTTPVPEIDGPAGLAALSAVGAVVAFIWERRRSRSK